MSTDDRILRELEALIEEERSVPPLPEADAQRIWSQVEASLRAPAPTHAQPAASAATTSAWIAGIGVATLSAVIVGIVIFASPSDERVSDRGASVEPDAVSSGSTVLDVVDVVDVLDVVDVVDATSARVEPPGPNDESVPAPEEVALAAPHDAVKAPPEGRVSSGRPGAPATPVETPAAPRGRTAPVRGGALPPAPAPGEGGTPAAEEAPREIELLREARRRLLGGDARGALEVVERHQQLWPGGVLGEERDALRVRALLGAGDLVRARGALEAFETRYPTSIHLEALRSHVGRASGAR